MEQEAIPTEVEWGPCCFCALRIESSVTDPCRLTVEIADGKWQLWFCHAHCFKDRLSSGPDLLAFLTLLTFSRAPRVNECNRLVSSVEQCENIVLMARAIKKNDPKIQRVPKGQKHPYTRWEGTPLWRVIEKAVCDLVQNQDLVEDEYHEYIVGYICKIIDRRKKVVIAQLKGQ